MEFLLFTKGYFKLSPEGLTGDWFDKDKKPFGVQTAAGLQCGCPSSVAKGGEVYPCPPSPFWIYDLPLKAGLSTHETPCCFMVCVSED